MFSHVHSFDGKKSMNDFVTIQQGFRMATSVGGVFTGRACKPKLDTSKLPACCFQGALFGYLHRATRQPLLVTYFPESPTHELQASLSLGLRRLYFK